MSTEIRRIGNLIYNKGTSTNSELDNIIIKCQEPKTNEVTNKRKDLQIQAKFSNNCNISVCLLTVTNYDCETQTQRRRKKYKYHVLKMPSKTFKFGFGIGKFCCEML